MTATGQRGPDPAGGDAPRVVVAGAGFGGLAAVRRLAQVGTQTTLIDRNIYATFQPLLYEVATAGLSSSDVAYPVRSVSRRHHAAFRHGELAGIDPAARRITLDGGTTLGYDYLILPAGQATLRASDSSGDVYSTSGLMRAAARPAAPVPGTIRSSPRADSCGDGQVRCFSPVLYAIDTVVPLISLDQRSVWYPDPNAPGGQFMLWWLNLATLLGWLLSSIFVLSLARLSRSP